ncbi:uncharacterized protein LOC134246338 [Saccostrea cucullata]|uniref:uncharacterized protein LOC134246338 n=1 Tax=Saccostrea cuccullata TaxID=36930 RepID=UPI002ED66D18
MENRGCTRRLLDRTQATPTPNMQTHPEATYIPGPSSRPMQPLQQTQDEAQPLPAATTQHQVSQQSIMQPAPIPLQTQHEAHPSPAATIHHQVNQQPVMQPGPIPAQSLHYMIPQAQPQQTFSTGPSHQPIQPQQAQQQTPTTQQVQPQVQTSNDQETVPVHSVHNLVS